ncbi:TIGR03557 family F420-dependent LLM class oxidoreductase [Mumia flava]|uniref:TIGR03557 family F420-dependent LLM class oxidoreductase n=1 Tax=Mumia flava TaxID=1348852 RepID=UPI0024820F71|nr:TIGR03557 family F420-dependent LLM class oxidoreductase [Mumia flava]
MSLRPCHVTAFISYLLLVVGRHSRTHRGGRRFGRSRHSTHRCPTLRYHPAIVAQKAATLQILAEGRFVLGLGSGENLNEHVVGERWPAIRDRHAQLAEAVGVIRSLHTGELVDHRGEYFQVDSARIWDLPDDPVEIGIAVAGGRAIETFAPLGDHLIGVEPDPSLVTRWNDVPDAPRVGDGARAIGQIPICWDPDEETAVKRAHEQFRWFAGGWSVNADLPTPAGFAGATQFVRPEDVAASIPCGPDLDRAADAIRAYVDAGFTDVAIVQVGDEDQDRFLDEAAGPLLERLRST